MTTTVFDAIREAGISARDVAQRYGLKFDRSGRACCPWHDDAHPSLKFFEESGRCYCHACHSGGDAVEIAAQILGCDARAAADAICSDFNLRYDGFKPSAESIARAEQRRRERQAAAEARDALKQRFTHLCAVIDQADALLSKYTPETSEQDYDNFTQLLRAKAFAQDEREVIELALREERLS